MRKVTKEKLKNPIGDQTLTFKKGVNYLRESVDSQS